MSKSLSILAILVGLTTSACTAHSFQQTPAQAADTRAGSGLDRLWAPAEFDPSPTARASTEQDARFLSNKVMLNNSLFANTDRPQILSE